MKVLIGCLFFRNYTGSELYVYELAKNLTKLKCKVTVVSAEISAEMQFRADVEDVEVIKPHELKGREFDVIHCQHQPVIEMLLKVYPNVPKICTIHSEVLKYEEPIFDKSIYKYVAIRKPIYDYLRFRGIEEKRIELIYNPIDETRFYDKKLHADKQDKEHLLFVGSYDYLRKKTIHDLIDYTHKEDLKLKIVGEFKDKDIATLSKYKHVEFFTPLWNVEKFVHHCKFTASILMGRTLIEGWMCGKSGWQYDVDANGNILKKELIAPPTQKEIENFYSLNVAQKIKNILKRTYENPF